MKKEVKVGSNFVKGKRLLKIKAYELDQVVKELRYGLILNSKNVDDLRREVLINDEYTLEEIVEILKEFPCGLKNESMVLNLARYLIEDNSSEYIEFNPSSKQETLCIIPILKKLLGKYTIWDN